MKHLLCAFLFLATYANATTYYIAANGNSTNNGTSQSTPWSLDKLNASWSVILPGDQILLQKGDVFNGGITIGKSGTASAPITIGSYGTASAKPLLNGLVTVSGWVSKGNGIYESTTTTPVDLMMVLINNKVTGQGRTPNAGSYYLSSGGGTSSSTGTNMPTTTNWTGATLGTRVSHWQIARYPITGQSGSTITFSNGRYLAGGYGLWIMNDIRTLDQFGEWYRNPTTGKLSMFFGTESPSSYNVEMSTIDNLIYSTSKSYVTIQGLSLKGSNNNAIDINWGTDITVTNCDIDASGSSGIDTKDHTNFTVTASKVTRSLNNGMHLNMYSTGDNIKATNNYIDSSYFIEGMGGSGQQDGNGITLGRAGLVQGNIVKHSGYCGVRFSAYLCTVKNNFIDTFCFVKDDGGGIYTGGNNPWKSTPKKTLTGNVILHSSGAAKGTPDTDNRGEGIYTDDDANHVDIIGNTVAYVDRGLYIHNNTDMVINANTFFSNIQNMYYRHDADTGITNIRSTKNIAFSVTTGQRIVYAANIVSGGVTSKMGIIDSNYYCRPIDEGLSSPGKALDWREGSTETAVTFSGWQSKFPNYDKATQKTAKTIASASEVRFEYNPTASPTDISLNGKKYIDPTGVPYTSGTLTLAPYSSKILLYTGIISGTAPTVSVATDGLQYNAPATVNITANASDDGSITKVDFYSGSTLLFSDNTVPYAYSWTNVTAGNYNITAKATDNTGLSTTSSTVAIAVNGVTAPSVALTSPANNSTYSAPATVNITASASDADGTVSKVDFYNGATLIGTDATSPYTFTWSNVAAGNYSITAKATDNSNLVTTSGAISITVSATGNTAPTVALNQPISGTQYSAPTTISIAATASDVDGTVQRVEFYAGNTLLNTDSVAPFSYTWTGVAVGNYNITAKAYDNLGASKTSAISTVTVVAPPSYPTVSLTSPINNAAFTAPATIDLTATASDANGIASVKFYSDSTLLYTVTTAPYTKSWANVAAGTYHITAVATDSTGLSTTSAARTITVQPVNNSVGVISGELKKWHKTTVTFDGPTTSETSTPNPALDYRLNVTFTHSSGETFIVPGYFAADGNAAETGATSGNKWRVHFSPDQTGTWTYTASFRQGTNIAVNDTVNVGTPVSSIDGATGTFTISANDKTGVDLRAKGRLNYVGSHLLQWAETKTYWRKNGTDAPENLLAYADVDNVSNYNNYRKTYTPHVADWKTGDPVWQSTKGKGLIGAINYLSSVGENSISFLTMNIRGDDRNVWPYIDTAQRTRMDVSKLDQWGIVFDHAESKGMHLHFKTQEIEGENILDGGNLGIQRKLYYRTLIARFGYHLALNWNLGEENTQTTQQEKDMANYFATHDPYHSNIVMHTLPSEQELRYRPLIGTASALTGVSIQKDTALGYAEVRKWVEASAATGKKWVVAWDEQGSAAVGVATDGNYTGNRGTVADNSDMIRRSVLWGTYMAGGDGVEYYYGYNTGETDLTLQDFRSRAKSYGYAKIAREFFDNYFPTTELKPLSNVSSTTAWSLGKDSFAYVVYLRYGGTTNITMPAGSYSVTWFNPRTGGATVNGSVTTIASTGTAKAIGNPPNTTTADWVALIQRFNTSATPPTVTLTSPANNSKYVVGDTIVLTATASGQNPIASVKFYSGTTLLFTETTAPYTRNWIGVAAGVYNITAVATDNAGLTTTTPVSVVTVQSTSVNKAPTVAITAPVNNAQYTAPATINITATASDADGTVKKVEFFNGSTLLATDTTSPYSYSWANVGVGNYNISARATDNSGNQTSSTPVAVTVGTAPVPPTVSLTSPINNATYTAPASITLTANATDGDGTIASVKFYNGATLIATVTTAPYTINWSNVAVGTYTFTAVATDNSGLSTTSGGVSVTVNAAPVNQPPTINLTAPATGSIYTSPTTINIAATAADADGTVSKVDFYNGNTLLSSDASSPYSYTWSGVGTGTYNITAKATDNSGAVTASTTSTITVNAPPVAPSVSLTSPANNTVYTSPATVSIAATASDPDGTVAKVDFYNGSTLLSSDATAPYAFTWSGVATGNYTITAKATDNTWLTTTSGAISVTVNSPANVPPSTSITSPANNSTFTQPTSLTIAVNATDADGSVTKVDFYSGATLLGSDVTAPFSFAWNNIAAGTYTLTAIATDNSGATATTLPVTVTVQAQNVPPSVAITSPANNAQYIAPAAINLAANATDADGQVTSVKFYNGTALVAIANTAPYTYTWNNVPAGSYSITAVATDNSGASTTSAPVSVSVRNVVAPSVAITSPLNNANYLAPASISVTIAASDPDGSVTKVELYRNNILVGTTTTNPFTVVMGGLAAGTYSLTAKAYDNDNLSTVSSAVTVVVNKPKIAPQVAITAPPQNSTFADPAELLITANATDADGTVARVDFYRDSTIIGTSYAAPYGVTWSSISAGVYNITARAIDNDSIVTVSAPITVNIVHINVAPSVSIVSPNSNDTTYTGGGFTFTAAANDPDGVIAKVEFYNNGVLLGATATAPYQFTWDNLSAGTYNVTAKAYDNSGAVTVSDPITVVVKDGSYPIIGHQIIIK